MINLLLASTISTSQPKQEIVNKFCSYLVGIPYKSDNFNNDEWQRFTTCVDVFTEPKQ